MPLRYLKSRAKYLIRFDDFCPTMNWSVWSRIEAILLSEGIRPLVAIVPDNLDKKLEVGRKIRGSGNGRDIGRNLAGQ